jgi:hypothetical protein
MIRALMAALGIAGLVPVAVAAETNDPAKLAAAVDARIQAGWKNANAKPAGVADDTMFLRRVTLDLLGRIPTVAETRAFLADKSPDKRAKLVDKLVASGPHAKHMASVWRRVWVPQTDAAEFARLADDFEAWAAVRLLDNVPYDRVVSEVLTTPLDSVSTSRGTNPIGFYTATENKPENLAATASRAFLGVNLDCAQCHDHPFARWSRDQFWQTAAFFVREETKAGNEMVPKMTIPGTKKTVSAEVMDGTAMKWPQAVTPDTGRKLLAGWVTGKENPYFAKNAVNRMWSHLFGTALYEPLDDLSGESGTPGPHAELLNELAAAFTASGYDLQFLTRALTRTKTYQLSSILPEGVTADPRLYSRAAVRGLTGEQLYDSLRTAAGLPPERDDTTGGLGRGNGTGRRAFAARFRIDRAVSAERSIVQALSMMNSRMTLDLTDASKNPTLAATDAPFLDTKGKVETLFLAAVGRKPTAKELTPLVQYVDDGGTEGDGRKALADVFWALVNSTEFNTNH